MLTSAQALPVALSMFLVSCSSTGSNLDAAGIGIQPSLTTTQAAVSAPSSAPNTPDGVAPPTPEEVSTALVAAPTPQPVTASDIKGATTPPSDQLDKNSQLVAAAAAAASNNAQLNAAAPGAVQVPVLTTPAQATAVVDAASGATTQLATPPKEDAQVAAATAANIQSASTPVVAATSPEVTPAAAKQAVLTAAPATQQVLTAAPAEPVVAAPPAKKKTLFDSLFSSNKQPAAAKVDAELPATKLALAATPAPKATRVAVEPVLQPAKLDLRKLEEPAANSSENAPALDNGELPGVRKGALFEIKRRDSLQDDSDVDIGETDHGPVLLASAAGMARLAPNGLKVQRESVDVACLKPQLVKVLKRIESHYNRPVVVTSGYRSPGYNRRVRGAKNSLHMYCAAADVQVAGISKWELARYARSMSGRGGVGTYCHTDSVHIDIGPDRDWNWRCSRRK